VHEHAFDPSSVPAAASASLEAALLGS
jgi:hypothetical protein